MSNPSNLAIVLNGLARKCPKCAKGNAFSSYLKIVDRCASCDEPLSVYRCDDGPAYFTMLLVGHIVVAPLFMTNLLFTLKPEIILPVLLGGILILTLVLLPFVKGAFLNWLWVLGPNGPKKTL
jgi:uncharacterized protein (DUF983 family)